MKIEELLSIMQPELMAQVQEEHADFVTALDKWTAKIEVDDPRDDVIELAIPPQWIPIEIPALFGCQTLGNQDFEPPEPEDEPIESIEDAPVAFKAFEPESQEILRHVTQLLETKFNRKELPKQERIIPFDKNSIIMDTVQTDNEIKWEAKFEKGDQDEVVFGKETPNDHKKEPKIEAKKKDAGISVFNNNSAPPVVLTPLSALEKNNAVVSKPTPEPIRPAEIVEQMVRHVEVNPVGAVSEIKMTLRPETLGNVTLKVLTDNGVITAQFAAESQQVKEIIETNFNTLRGALQQQGLDVAQLSVSVGGGNAGQSRQTPQQAYQPRKNKILETFEEIPIINPKAYGNQVNYSV